MIRFATSVLCLATTACFFDHSGPEPGDDIVGPFTGARTRYVADSMLLPMNNAEARLYGGDLNGDNTVDNQLGQVISTLLQVNPAEQHIADRIAGGELTLEVEIQADNLQNDDAVGVWVFGFGDQGAKPTGGELVDGTFVPNFVRDTAANHTGSAIIPLPLIADADTSNMEVPYMEISLVPDGNGGFDAQIHGVVRNAQALASAAIEQQLVERPEQHRWMWSLMDVNHDGYVTGDEVRQNSLLQALLAPDLDVDVEKLLSFGIGFHLRACPSGNCAASTPADACFDRIQDGDETDVDCGGETCGPCGPDLACAGADDCQSGTCMGNACTAPSCFDGIKNGFEASADCGGACAKKCEVGQVCGMDLDCQYRCSASYSGGTGVCQRGP